MDVLPKRRGAVLWTSWMAERHRRHKRHHRKLWEFPSPSINPALCDGSDDRDARFRAASARRAPGIGGVLHKTRWRSAGPVGASFEGIEGPINSLQDQLRERVRRAFQTVPLKSVDQPIA